MPDPDLEIRGGGGVGLQKKLFLSFGPQFSLKIRGTGRAVKGVSYSSGKSTEKRELFVNLSDHIRTRDADKRRTYVLLLVLYLESPFSRTNKCALKVFLFLAGCSDFYCHSFSP